MRIFYYRVVKNVIMIYVFACLFLSYRLVYNEIYDDIYFEIEASGLDDSYVYPSGKIVGIYTECDGVFVIDTCEVESKEGDFIAPSEDVVKTGDYIIAIDGEVLSSKEDMIRLVKDSEGKPLILTVSRKNECFQVEVSPVLGKNGGYMLGIWVKDDLAGVGTVTYISPNGNFAALGHGMGNGETNELLKVKRGEVYTANVFDIEKGEKGDPGEIKAIIAYGAINHVGNVDSNSGMGIYGKMDAEDIERFSMNKAYPVATKHEIEIGPAQIISEVSGEKKVYDIKIIYVDYLAVNTNKGLHIEVVDEDLLDLTGGIIQGMSGSPIIQNGKIVGAVTHVLINNPTSGYGIFIENMVP